ncbi:MAG: flavodoxin domain-containing protein [Nitrososphaerota archaeon]|nr:flavodoxin domain-containing protein [Candidatus Bathyarchaeota archaeon]MDW8194073.1 flavodoxin domain-containing protein [Nitrososphaerota archaeon]
MVRVLIVYDSRTGNTEKLAKALASGACKVSGIEVVLKRAREVSSQDVASADAYAFGSPSHFGIMSGEILTMFTNIYPERHSLAGKPACVFTTGAGSQVTALENIDRILGAFNPKWIKPGIAVEGEPKQKDLEQAEKLGEKLAKAALSK